MNSTHFPDVNIVEPPEVVASVPEPPEVSLVSIYELSACLIMAKEAICEFLPFPLPSNESDYELLPCSEPVMNQPWRLIVNCLSIWFQLVSLMLNCLSCQFLSLDCLIVWSQLTNLILKYLSVLFQSVSLIFEPFVCPVSSNVYVISVSLIGIN